MFGNWHCNKRELTVPHLAGTQSCRDTGRKRRSPQAWTFDVSKYARPATPWCQPRLIKNTHELSGLFGVEEVNTDFKTSEPWAFCVQYFFPPPQYHFNITWPDETQLVALLGVCSIVVNYESVSTELVWMGWTFQAARLPDLDLAASEPADRCCCKQTTRSNDEKNYAGQASGSHYMRKVSVRLTSSYQETHSSSSSI